MTQQSILTVENLYKSFGDKVIFENLCFGINKGQKVALVGRNGEGKSTLLNMLFDEQDRQKGKVIFNSLSDAVYLPQKTWKNENISIINEVLSIANTDLEHLPENFSIAKSHTHTLVDYQDHAAFLSKIKEMLYIFGLKDINKPLNLLSGGEQKKVALAKVVIQKSNFYVLDEPTNHLDIDMIKWLENFLSKQSTLLIVTHDRELIDNVCSDIYELYKGEINKYHGNFEYFLTKKQEQIDNFNAQIDKAKNLYNRELDWINRMPQARGTKSKKRIENFENIKEMASQTIDTPQEKLSIVETRVGKKILEINSISKSFDRPIIKDFSYTFKKLDKIAVIGHNGCGKTTLLNIITGLEKPDSGTIIKGETIEFGYYRQEGMQISQDKRVIDIISDIASSIKIMNNGKSQELSASNFLSRFGFNKDMQFHKYALLSGGERRRLYLLMTLIKNPNFLILDEPTNDLDIYSLLTLEEFLQQYKGCLLIVSHDRRFIENISHNHAFIFEQEGAIKDYYLPYSQYLKDQKEQQKQSKSSINNANNSYAEQKQRKNLENKKNKLSFNEKRLKEELEKELPLLEQKKEELTNKLSSNELNNEELQSISIQIEELIKTIDQKETQWLMLCDKEE